MDWNNVIYLDLFSGVGGFTHGFLNAGMKFKKHYFSEIDKHSIAVYKYLFHEAEAVGDITAFSGDGIERPNLITFGFPCQDLSIAGKQAGLAGSRSGLFFQALRLIERFKPEVFIFENVAGLLSSNEGQDFEIVLRAIADIGIYECEWQLVNTRWLLPQNRERVYFVGHLAGRSKPRVFPFREDDKIFRTSARKQFQWEIHTKGYDEIANCLTSRMWKMGKTDNFLQVNQINPSLESGGQQPYQQNRVYDAEGISPALHSLSEKMNISVRPILTPDREEKRQNGRRMKEDGEPAFTLNTQDRNGVVITNVARGFNDGGDKDICPTITKNSFENNNFVNKIRRLTEVECERLQGFPDGHTAFGNYDGVIKKVPKTQRYKQMGNAVTTLWPQLIAQRLMND